MNTTGPVRERSGYWYFFLLILVNAMWAFQYSGARIATQKLGPIAVALFPMVMSTVLLSLLLFLGHHKKQKEALHERGTFGRQLLSVLILGLVGTVIAQLGLTSGVKRSLASNGSVITLAIPVLTAVLATVLLGEKISRLLWISFGLAIAGVLLVSDIDWRTVHIFHGKYLLGNALILIGCFGSAFYNSFSKRLLRTLSPLEVLVYSFIVADVALFVAMLALEPMSWDQLASLGFAVWLSLGMIALFTLTLAMMLFFWVIQRIAVTQAALSFYLMPVFGVLISTIVLREKVRWQLIVGGFLVFVGTFLATTYGEHMRAKGSHPH